MSVTGDWCEQIVALGSPDVDDRARSAVRRLVLDGLAVAVAGAPEDAVRLLVAHQETQNSGPGPASVIGHAIRCGTVAAARINGAAMHVLDFEPMWSPANHALSTTLPVVLALAESIGASGEAATVALLKGIEVQGWLRQASGQWAAKDLIFHPPGVVGPLGAAAAAGHLLGLDAGELAHALGIAASGAGGLLGNVGTMTKALHCGAAAAAGCEAALLAAAGFTANPDILDVPQGMAAAFFPGWDPQVLRGFGPPWRAVEPGFALKLYPSQYGTHFGITVARRLHHEIGATPITAVRLTTPVMPYVDRPRPARGLEGKFSLQYTACLALLDGMVRRASFTDQSLARPELQALLAMVQLRQDRAIPPNFEAMHVVVEVDLADGRRLTQR
ncbi:MAG: MmgE/PrpD family protein, partial [Acidimicrobiales bacterium]